MLMILCQLEAVHRFISDSRGDPNLQACREGLRQAIEALKRHLQASASR
ncbi:hypothetical protein [Methylobacterium sp. Leaf361]|nr:hypothetical protein [Methylobacterium sp. Leaf361]